MTNTKTALFIKLFFRKNMRTGGLYTTGCTTLQRQYFDSSFSFPLAFSPRFLTINLYVINFSAPIFSLDRIRRFASLATFGGACVGGGDIAVVSGGEVRHRTGD